MAPWDGLEPPTRYWEEYHRQLEGRWNERYQELCAFHRSFGHLRIPKDWSGGKNLSKWLIYQRKQPRRLTEEQKQKLLALDPTVFKQRRKLSDGSKVESQVPPQIN